MSFRFAVLSSGSKSTSFYVACDDQAVLVDAGLKFADVEARLKQLGEKPEYIRACAISHHHGDHSGGLKSIIKSIRCPLLLRIAQAGGPFSDLLLETKADWFSLDIFVRIGCEFGYMQIATFPTQHDAVDSRGFIIDYLDLRSTARRRIVIATDLGSVPDSTLAEIQRADLFFLESNYDDDILAACEYGEGHKERIRRNHLSNEQARAVVAAMKPCQRCILGHISETSNSAELVAAMYQNNPQVTVLKSGDRSELFSV